jgi:hypothetical protein
MNTKLLDAIANAVLYEGYMLYPYRPSSVKNRQRFNFGVLYPRAYSEAQSGSDAWNMQTEVLVEGSPSSTLEIRVRFLKLVERSVRKLKEPILDKPAAFQVVPVLEVDDRKFQSWQEAVECEVVVPASTLTALLSSPLEWNFTFPAKEEDELLRETSGWVAGSLTRKQDAVSGSVEVSAVQLGKRVFKLQVRVNNLVSSPSTRLLLREHALMQSLISAHTVLGGKDGQFVSLLDPPENLRDFAANCQNAGTWPVLVGEADERDTMLSSPIILYDYPQIAPESPGDLFDGTEIDEILALRIMTLTEDEKREMSQSDERTRKILERTEALPPEYLAKLHGTFRELSRRKEDAP